MWDDEEVGAGLESRPVLTLESRPVLTLMPGLTGGRPAGVTGPAWLGPRAGLWRTTVRWTGTVTRAGDQGGEQDGDGDDEDGPGVASSRGAADGRAEGDDVMQLLPEGLVERDEHLEQLRALVALKSVATVADCLGEERETVAHLLDRTLVMDRSMRALVEREVARATDDGLGFELEQFVEAGEAQPDAPIVLDLQGSFQEAEEAELAAAA